MRVPVAFLLLTVVGLLATPLYGQAPLPEPGEIRTIFRDRDDVWSLSWSPDGRQIAFGRRPFVANPSFADIWVVGADGSNPRRLTGQMAGEHNWYPAWSPDGRHIAFYRWRAERSEIWIMNADGSGGRQLTNLGHDARYPSWSPDGTKIVFAVRRDRNWDLFMMNADGSGVTPISEGAEREEYPRFLGDGTRVIYARAFQLRILDLSTRESRVVTVGPNDTDPNVSVDGRYIVYSSRKAGDFSHLWVIRTEDALEGMVPDTKARQLTRGSDVWGMTPAFSLDGTMIAFARRTRSGGVWGPGEIWTVALK